MILAANPENQFLDKVSFSFLISSIFLVHVHVLLLLFFWFFNVAFMLYLLYYTGYRISEYLVCYEEFVIVYLLFSL